MYQTEYNIDRIDTRDLAKQDITSEYAHSEIVTEDKDDSLSLDGVNFLGGIDSSPMNRTDGGSSNRQKLLFDDEDIFRNLAATMRNPNINNLNILDTMANAGNLSIRF